MIVISDFINVKYDQVHTYFSQFYWMMDSHISHRIVYPGLNFEGKCVNPKCSVNNKMVWVSLGYGNMQYTEKQFQCPCPICKVELEPENIANIGYRYAKVKFVGRQENDTKNKVEYSDEEREGKLVKFTGGSDGKTVGWVYLNIHVDKL